MARGIHTRILTWNCESLPAKKQDADILMAEKNPVAFCFQDTRLTANSESQYNLAHEQHSTPYRNLLEISLVHEHYTTHQGDFDLTRVFFKKSTEGLFTH